jgi:hypothetical protein
MHERLIAYLDPSDKSVLRIEELEVELEVRRFLPCLLSLVDTNLFLPLNQTIYPNGPNLMLDYARCSRPQYV